MQALFVLVNDICAKIQVISDLFWDFPTNFAWYKNIPVLGNFSMAIILLIGSGIYFTLRLNFVQLRRFSRGIEILKESKASCYGLSPLTSFFLSTAMRVGPGNILGVTGAVSTGGPGALFWMWVSAFFGMSTAFTESTLAQIFKEKKDYEYIGGLSFYGSRLLGGSTLVGICLSSLYIVYALLCLPAQGFNTISSVGQIAELLSGGAIPTNSPLYWTSFGILMLVVVMVTFGGIRAVTSVTDVLVPVMAVLYFLVVAVLVGLNLGRIPWFFSSVFTQAFTPEAIFGGAFGLALVQGVKRGLMSNEAGQGTITMPAAASDVKHPCEQGFVQAVGVFLDTMVICTMTGFVVVMGRVWQTDAGSAWMKLGKLPKYIASVGELSPSPEFNLAICLLISLSLGLFAFTCLLGFISFSEICANRISTSSSFICCVRVLCLTVISFGVLTNIAGMDLGSLWDLSDFANILIAYCNIPLLYIGFKYVLKALRHYDKKDGTAFSSQVIGFNVPVWDNRSDNCIETEASVNNHRL